MTLLTSSFAGKVIGGAVLVMAAACLASAQAPVTASIPYIAFGGVTTPGNVNAWTTELVFTNLGPTPASVGIRWYGDNGLPLAVPVVGSGRNTTHQFQVASNATLDLVLDNTGDPLTGGWAAVDILGSVDGQAIFHSDLTGRPEYSAAAPLARHGGQSSLILLGGGIPVTTFAAPRSLALPFNNVGNVTGASFANITSIRQTLTLNYLDDSGNQLLSQTITLGPQAHTSFPTIDPKLAGTKGVIMVTGDGSPYSAIAFVMANSGTIATLLPTIQ